MVPSLRQHEWAERVQETFQVLGVTPTALDLRLVSVTGAQAPPGYEAFSLLFHGPADTLLPQSIRQLRHPAIGDFELFLVPVGRDGDGFVYEAAFNRRKPPLGTTH